jgi:hypothetical protein
VRCLLAPFLRNYRCVVPPEGFVRKLAFATPAPHASVPVRQHVPPLASLRPDGRGCRKFNNGNLFGNVPLTISRLTALTKLYVPRPHSVGP